ncbi:tetraketide alpha-pyrone reductase 2 isoform X2 [Spinacia oleracea]|uniref:Tetraketide alpha-pyrone reductase 2 isoform X2 n=1 Tax=Spinacia oleracea TaxID=3562 RepID=A0A9R0JQK1_SPIOL|nr:tetraketide alpha-pyrone reductase 2-like isoform X2 [Spinacia oleracea]
MREYCVTGATGFVASHLIKVLLENGCSVRATVRDPDNVEKVGFLWEMNGAKERLKLFKSDLMVNGSFDEVIEGVDGVFHVASPAASLRDGEDVQSLLIDPCINGILNVLNSCSKTNTVKRIVLTSSRLAIKQRQDVDQIPAFNESHWSDLEYCKRNNMWYAYAKTIGEKTAWKVAEERNLDLVVVHPSFVIGPLLAPYVSSSLKYVLDLIKGAKGGYPNGYCGFVHVEDVAAAHILAMEESKASGRLICSSSVAHWSDVVASLRTKYPMYPFETKLNDKEGDRNQHTMDATKILHLGFPSFKTIPQIFDDCIKSFQAKGIL